MTQFISQHTSPLNSQLPSSSASQVGSQSDLASAFAARLESHHAKPNAMAARARSVTYSNLPRNTANAAPASAFVYVDSMASEWIATSMSQLLRVTDDTPPADVVVSTVNGEVPVRAIGVVGMWLLGSSGAWHYFEMPNVHVVPKAPCPLYSVATARRVHGIMHDIDHGLLRLPGGDTVPFCPDTFALEVVYGGPHDRPVTDMTTPTAFAAFTGSLTQSLLYQRLGFPHEHAWRWITSVTSRHGQPPNAPMRTDFPQSEAVIKGRMRAKPFADAREPHSLPAPGSTFYLDHAGPMIPSFPHRFTSYAGGIDAGSGYARVFPVHSADAASAELTVHGMITDISHLMGLTNPLKPSVIKSDQGSAFMANYFQDFLGSQQIAFHPATAYTPQQNSFVERMWGVRFGGSAASSARTSADGVVVGDGSPYS